MRQLSLELRLLALSTTLRLARGLGFSGAGAATLRVGATSSSDYWALVLRGHFDDEVGVCGEDDGGRMQVRIDLFMRLSFC
jgi:hypothetical protein